MCAKGKIKHRSENRTRRKESRENLRVVVCVFGEKRIKAKNSRNFLSTLFCWPPARGKEKPPSRKIAKSCQRFFASRGNWQFGGITARGKKEECACVQIFPRLSCWGCIFGWKFADFSTRVTKYKKSGKEKSSKLSHHKNKCKHLKIESDQSRPSSFILETCVTASFDKSVPFFALCVGWHFSTFPLSLCIGEKLLPFTPLPPPPRSSRACVIGES